ncbi:hypothetical protein [Paenibacillus planticolens]|uniref:Uncharacterized protein n=1 Tax=Paenibacillus planticolens TaxID=2654976 RepID=A0ABX1ZXS3_9BACL|nr:hypothetical protein [Paenibacillus planticolens]NOV04742.1 hypothetical protein [Paenibacillus planticolens]
MDDIIKRKFWQRMKGLNFEHFCDAMNELHTRAYELAQQHMTEAMSCQPRISANMIAAVKEKAVQIREEWDDCREILTVESTLEKLLEEIIERKYGPGMVKEE